MSGGIGMAMRLKSSTPVRGFSALEVLVGVSIGLGVWMMALHAWGVYKQWLSDRDSHQELLDRTPTLHRLLSRLTRQVGSRPLSWNGTQWQASAAYTGLPWGSNPTWVHARGIHDQAASYPSCQNTRVWASAPNSAPALIQDQFSLQSSQLKCKDLSQGNATWQGWIDQASSWQVWLAWQSGTGPTATWRWRGVNDGQGVGQVVGIRVCLVTSSLLPVLVRASPPLDCQDKPLADQGFEWRVWTRVWSMRVGLP
jgi:type II secretory pathway component PulJ